jgi:NRPS condensation-like uncharacterized protein
MNFENAKKINTDFPPWMPLDNAAKIYPAAKSRRTPSMFRLSMELTEEIDKDVLAAALKSTMKRMPSFSQHLKRGLFWYYLEHHMDYPPICHDINNPCVYLDVAANKGFQFRVCCYQKRIAVDFFHVLTDGTGGMSFLKTLVAEYISLKYGVEVPRGKGILDCKGIPQREEFEDSFLKYARPIKVSRKEAPAYHIQGTLEPVGVIHITTGIIPLDEIHAKAGEAGATINEYLVAVLILAIYNIQQAENNEVRKKLAVKVSIPINLRKRFSSNTLRNFTTYANLGIVPALGSYTLQEVIDILKHGMALETNEKVLAAKFSSNVAAEKNPAMKITPLFIKNPIMRIYYKLYGGRYNSTALSNLGLISLPEEMAKYVDRISFIIGAGENPVACSCVSFGNKLCFSISRTIVEPLLEHQFFTMLVNLGIKVTLESNIV